MAFDVMRDPSMPDYAGNIWNAFGQGQALAQQQIATQQRNQLGQLSAQAYQLNPNDMQAHNDLLSQMAAISPAAATQQQQEFQSLEQARQGHAQLQMQQVAQAAASIGAMPDSPAKDQAWQTMLAHFQASGGDTTAFQGLPTNLGIKLALAKIANSQELLNMATPNAQKSNEYKPLQTDQGYYAFDPTTGTVKPVMAPGASGTGNPVSGPAPVGGMAGLPAETQAYVPKVNRLLNGQVAFDSGGQATPALLNAIMQVESGGNTNAVSKKGAQGPFQIMPATAQALGVTNPFDLGQARAGAAKYLGQLYQQFGGNADQAIAAYNAGPGAVSQAFGGAASPGAVPGILMPPGKAGGKPDLNLIGKRQEELASLQAAGVPLNAQQQQDYLLTGKVGSESTDLSPQQEQMAQAIAHYQLPVSAYGMAKDKLQPIIARALEINPSYAENNYAQSHKILQDLASSSPTSAGGMITAAGTALGHLNSMADVSSNLPNMPTGLNAISNYVQGAANIGDARDLKAWNTGKNMLAGELSKMVKGGVASEGEVNQMLDQLNPNDPNRNEALARMGQFMMEKVQALESARDNVLGSASPQTSLLTAGQQKMAQRVLGLSPNIPVPQFRPPGGRGMTVPSSASTPSGAPPSASAPMMAVGTTATNPQTGHKIRWNGSSWEDAGHG